jgi:hypothetical protein
MLLTGIAQIASAIAIVLSLIFVGIQLRQATHAVKASSSQAHAAMYQALSAGLIDNFDGFARLWRIGLAGTQALTDDERTRFYAFASSQIRFFESARVQWLRNQLDVEHWRAVTRQAQDLAAQPGVREFWAARRHWHCIHFQRWFESLFEDSGPSVGPSPKSRTIHLPK